MKKIKQGKGLLRVWEGERSLLKNIKVYKEMGAVQVIHTPQYL